MHLIVYITFYHHGYSRYRKILLGPLPSPAHLIYYGHIGGLNNYIPRKYAFISNH